MWHGYVGEELAVMLAGTFLSAFCSLHPLPSVLLLYDIPAKHAAYLLPVLPPALLPLGAACRRYPSTFLCGRNMAGGVSASLVLCLAPATALAAYNTMGAAARRILSAETAAVAHCWRLLYCMRAVILPLVPRLPIQAIAG